MIEEIFHNEILRWNNTYNGYVKIVNRKNAQTKLIMDPFHRKITLSIPKRFEKLDDEIAKGLIHSLMTKLDKNFSPDKESIKLYNSFIKQLSNTINGNFQDEILKKTFDHINLEYFNNSLSECNLKWSKTNNYRTLGTYNFSNNTITISKALKNASERILGYVMYHEMLHKAVQFKGITKRTYHTKQFRELEKHYEGFETIEQEIRDFIKKSIKQHWWQR